jgi:stage II sporulation protein D
MPRHALRAAAVAAALIAVAVLVLGGSDPALSASGLRVPNHAVIAIHGRGYGHGHGLSQYGAEGAARKGLSARQILGFYYPHTRTGQYSREVRVWITEDTDNNTTVVNGSGLTLHDLANGKTWTLPQKGTIGAATRWRLSSTRSGQTQVSYRTGGAWHVWRGFEGDGAFLRPGGVALVLPGGPVTYRGAIQSRTPTTGKPNQRITIDKLPLDQYVEGVVPREMPSYWHPAALRAQAVAARTYAAYETDHSTNGQYDLCDTSSCQVYGGKSAEVSSTNDAVAKTAHQIRTYAGGPAFTQFSASNGGWTAHYEVPYLPAKQDPYDGWSGNPYSSWTVNVAATKIEKAWPALGNLESIQVNQRDGNGLWGGRILALTLTGSKSALSMTGTDFQSTLGLRSEWLKFTIATTGKARLSVSRPTESPDM